MGILNKILRRKVVPVAYIHVDPSWPHQGFSKFSEEKSAFECALVLEGMSADAARAHFMGKVFAFERLSDSERAALRDKSFKVNEEKLKGLLR